MKILVVSDLHNDIEYTKAVVDIFKSQGFDKLYLLGDLLVDSIKILNQLSDKILAVKGNCDGYDDYDSKFNMPYINFDYQFNRVIVLTHGHYYSEYNYEQPFDIMLVGHSHISKIFQNDRGQIIANPGSISNPRDGIHSYMTIDDDGIKVIDYNSKAIVHSLNWR